MDRPASREACQPASASTRARQAGSSDSTRPVRHEHEPVVIADDQVTRRDGNAAEDDGLVDAAAFHRRGAARRDPAAEHVEVGPAADRGHVSDATVDHDARDALARAAPPSNSPMTAMSRRPPAATTMTSPADAAAIA